MSSSVSAADMRVLPLAGFQVGHCFARKLPTPYTTVFNFGNYEDSVRFSPKFAMAPRTGYGMWVDGGVDNPQHYLCFPLAPTGIEYISNSKRFIFDSGMRIASVVPPHAERVLLSRQTPNVEIEVANVAGSGEIVDNITDFNDTTVITNMSTVGSGSMLVLTCYTTTGADFDAVRVINIETKQRLFGYSARFGIDAMMNDDQNLLVATTTKETLIFDTRRQATPICTLSSDTTARIAGMTRSNTLILCNDGGRCANFWDLRTGLASRSFSGPHHLTWDKYNDLLCGVSQNGKSVVTFDLQTGLTNIVPFAL